MLRIYTKFQGMKYNASTYYRLQLPLDRMQALYPKDVLAILDPADDQINDEERWQHMGLADVLLTYQLIEPRFVPYMHFMRGIPPAEDENNELRHTPSFVTTTDDDIFAVPPLNPAFRTLGWSVNGVDSLPETSDPEKPTTISIQNAATGERIPLWIDGHENFSIAKNKRNLEGWRQILRESEATVVSTPRLGKRIIEETGQPDRNIIVYPNCVDFDAYKRFGTIDLRPHPEEIRILYQGSTTHHEDLWPLRKAFGNLARKYPNIKWIFWGVNYKWAASEIPPAQVEFLPWVHYWAYALRMMTIGHDIAIAPLSNSRFNNSRSAIKWYEASVAGAACCAQRNAAYEDEMLEGETGLLFANPDEFELKMSQLIEDAQLRKTLVSNSRDWLRMHRDPDAHARVLYAKLMDVRTARNAWTPEMQAEYKRRYDEATKDEPVPTVGDQPAPGSPDRPGLCGPDGQRLDAREQGGTGDSLGLQEVEPRGAVGLDPHA